MKNLNDKVAILTGVSRGLGPHIARALAAEGVALVITARTAQKLSEVAEELKRTGVKVLSVPADLNKQSDRKRIVDRAIAEFGRIDILVNNAGVVHCSEFAQQDAGHISEMVDTNLKAPVLLTHTVLPHMLNAGSGHIVTLGSLSGKRGLPYLSIYSGTKAALMEWSNALRLELDGTGINVSTLCPTYVSQAGMFEREDVEAPPMIGTVSAETVAHAVVRAIRFNKHEMLLSPYPMRPLLVLNAIAPRLATGVLKLAGIVRVGRELAASQAAKKTALKKAI